MQPKFTKIQTVSQAWIRINFALSTFGSWYSDAVLGTVRLIANKIKGCKSLRLLSFTNSTPQCISTTSTLTNVTTFFMFLKMTDEKLFVGFNNFGDIYTA